MDHNFDGQNGDLETPVVPLLNLTRERLFVGIPLLAMAFVFLFSGVVQVLLHTAFSLFLPSFTKLSWYWTILSALSLYGVSMPLSLLIYRIVPPCAPQRKKLSVWVILGLFCITFSLTYVGNVMGIIVNAIISAVTGEPQINDFAQSVSESSFLENLITVGILAPIMEELFFRKAVLDRIAQYGDVPAMLISGIAFGLVHGNFSQFFYAAMVGILFGYVYLRTGKIRYTIALHMGINLLGGVYAAEMAKRTPSEFSTLGDLVSYLTSVGGMMYVIYLLIMGACFVGAVIAVVLLWKRIRFRRAERRLTLSQWVRVLALNPATLLFCFVVLLLFLS